jgi:hypothetical protein
MRPTSWSCTGSCAVSRTTSACSERPPTTRVARSSSAASRCPRTRAGNLSDLGYRINLVGEHLVLDETGTRRGFITLCLYWKHTKDFLGVAPTGREGTSIETLLLTVEDGEVNRIDVPDNTADLVLLNGSAAGRSPTTSSRRPGAGRRSKDVHRPQHAGGRGVSATARTNTLLREIYEGFERVEFDRLGWSDRRGCRHQQPRPRRDVRSAAARGLAAVTEIPLGQHRWLLGDAPPRRRAPTVIPDSSRSTTVLANYRGHAEAAQRTLHFADSDSRTRWGRRLTSRIHAGSGASALGVSSGPLRHCRPLAH